MEMMITMVRNHSNFFIFVARQNVSAAAIPVSASTNAAQIE
jgi:hypothetical protein